MFVFPLDLSFFPSLPSTVTRLVVFSIHIDPSILLLYDLMSFLFRVTRFEPCSLTVYKQDHLGVVRFTGQSRWIQKKSRCRLWMLSRRGHFLSLNQIALRVPSWRIPAIHIFTARPRFIVRVSAFDLSLNTLACWRIRWRWRKIGNTSRWCWIDFSYGYSHLLSLRVLLESFSRVSRFRALN